jgi:hypothetical protein
MQITNHRDAIEGQFTNPEGSMTPFLAHSKNKSPITVHENTSLFPCINTFFMQTSASNHFILIKIDYYRLLHSETVVAYG